MALDIYSSSYHDAKGGPNTPWGILIGSDELKGRRNGYSLTLRVGKFGRLKGFDSLAVNRIFLFASVDDGRFPDIEPLQGW